MAEKLREVDQPARQRIRLGDSLFIILSIYILSINLYTYYLSSYLSGGVRDGACPGGRQGTPRLYNQLMNIFYCEVCRKGEADTGGTFGHCRRANGEAVEAFSL